MKDEIILLKFLTQSYHFQKMTYIPSTTCQTQLTYIFSYHISINQSLNSLIHVELGHLQEDISIQSLTKVYLQLVANKEVLKFSLVGHLSKINSAKVFKHGLDKLQNFIGESLLIVESEQEVDFSSLVEFS